MSRSPNSSRQGGADGDPEPSTGDVTSMTTRIHGHMLDSRALLTGHPLSLHLQEPGTATGATPSAPPPNPQITDPRKRGSRYTEEITLLNGTA